jgi:hypothetical protein
MISLNIDFSSWDILYTIDDRMINECEALGGIIIGREN